MTDRAGLIRRLLEAAGPPFAFDRYINGILMAEGVIIERAATIEEAARVAALIASRGPNGEAPVLVYRPRAALLREAAKALGGE